MSFVNQFFISDTHFSHNLMMMNRPFSSIEEMDEHMIEMWNLVVDYNDIVWHLGDFSFADERNTRIIFNRLKGRKRLILGNHDMHRDGTIKPSIARLHWDIPPQQMAHIVVDRYKITLCHYAMLTWPAQYRGALHFFGHSHGNLKGPAIRSRDVGVDVEDVWFTPRKIEELLPGMEFGDE